MLSPIQLNCIAGIKMVFFTTQLFWQKLYAILSFSILVAPHIGILFYQGFYFVMLTIIDMVNQLN